MKGINEASKSRLKISDDVIITVARLAALDVKGVAGLSGEINAISKILNNGPISVDFMEDVASVSIGIKVKSGFKVVNIAQDVQNTVKENIQNMTGVAVARVNVIINGIVFE